MDKVIESRIMSCLNVDKKKSPSGVSELVKADIINVLKNYFDVNETDTLIKIEACTDGGYSIKMVSKASFIKPINILR